MISIQYIAGFFDADGHIYLSKHGSGKNGIQKFRRPHLGFTNADLSIIQDIRSELGGNVAIKNRNRGENINVAYSLDICGKAAKPALELIYPYVRHLKKKERIRILLEDYYPITRTDGQGGSSYTPEVVAKKLEIEERFMNIIMRGKGAY